MSEHPGALHPIDRAIQRHLDHLGWDVSLSESAVEVREYQRRLEAIEARVSAMATLARLKQERLQADLTPGYVRELETAISECAEAAQIVRLRLNVLS